MAKITAYPQDTAPTTDDFIITVDSGSGSNRKATIGNLATTVIGTAGLPTNGWYSTTSTVSSVLYNGNRSYTIGMGSDLSSVISAGYRLRTTRTVAAPTQCASLNGTNNYFSKTSPAGMTFTDDFVVSAWVKLTSYGGANDQSIVSRYNGTSGWDFVIMSTGQVRLAGFNASSANYSYVASYQSIPLNKWVHVTAQLDMSSFTATPTTSYVMIDGVDVPAFVTRAGTNPTALIQAGNLEISSRNGGTQFLPGKIAQVAIFNAKVTQANVRATISQTLAGTETSLISAYSFNNSITDLNANANNLTNNNSTSITNADSPFGGQAGGTISSTLDYAIIQTVSASTLVVQVPEGCTIPTSGGVSAVSYSGVKMPYGFPGQKEKWTLYWSIRAALSVVVVSTSAWLNITGAQYTLPIGEFDLVGVLTAASTNTSAAFSGMSLTLSTATTTQSFDIVGGRTDTSTASTEFDTTVTLQGNISNSAQTTWYINAQPIVISGTTTAYIQAQGIPAILRFTNAYL